MEAHVSEKKQRPQPFCCWVCGFSAPFGKYGRRLDSPADTQDLRSVEIV
jgi:hypothetical protein